MPAKIKALTIRPVTGPMDARSSPDETDLNGYRYVRNFGVTAKGKLCRIPGFDKLLTGENFNNSDLHDQLLSQTGFPSRQPVTFAFEAISTRKQTKLLAGTRNAIYALNSGTGNWKVISDRLGSEGTRWEAASLSDTVVFTNNFNPPQYWLYDQGVTEANDQSVAPIPQLTAIGISKVGTVVAWNGHIFLMNVVQNGAVRSSSIFWSNFLRPLDWTPNDGSTAGSFDLDYGETILAALPLANRLIVYTNKGIWEGLVSTLGGFAFSKRYDPVNGENCLFYPNTLVSIGDEHVYAGSDGIYTYSIYESKPKRPEWMHSASSVMFDYLNRTNCEVHIGAYNSDRKELLISYAKNDETLPSETIVFNTQYPHAYILDHGFSAMLTHVAKTSTAMLRDFLLTNCICDADEMDSLWNEFQKEGGFCTVQPVIECESIPASLWTTDEKVITYDGESVTVEDYDKEEPDEDSLCTRLEGLTLQGACETELRQDECSSGQRFVVASSVDYCLKEFSNNYYREEALTFTGCGTYARRGYRSLLRWGAISAGLDDAEKEISRFELEATAIQQGVPSKFYLKVGRHSQAVDPNADDCGIVWNDQDPLEIKCLGVVPAATHLANKTVPSETYEWPLYYIGNYLYLELEVKTPGVTPQDTGGGTCISRFTVDLRPIVANW